MVVRVRLEDIEGIRNSKLEMGYLVCERRGEESRGILNIPGWLGNNAISSNVAGKFKKDLEVVVYYVQNGRTVTKGLPEYQRMVLESLDGSGFDERCGTKNKVLMIRPQEVALYGFSKDARERFPQLELRIDLRNEEISLDLRQRVIDYIAERRKTVVVYDGENGEAKVLMGNLNPGLI